MNYRDGDNYANAIRLYIGPQATPNTTPTDLLTVNGSIFATHLLLYSQMIMML